MVGELFLKKVYRNWLQQVERERKLTPYLLQFLREATECRDRCGLPGLFAPVKFRQPATPPKSQGDPLVGDDPPFGNR